MKFFSQFVNEGKVPYRQMGNGMHGNFRYAPPQDGWGTNFGTSSKPTPEKKEKKEKPLSDDEIKLMELLKDLFAGHHFTPNDIPNVDAKKKRTLESLVKRGIVSKHASQAGPKVNRYIIY